MFYYINLKVAFNIKFSLSSWAFVGEGRLLESGSLLDHLRYDKEQERIFALLFSYSMAKSDLWK